MDTKTNVLVLGASGGVGGETARRLVRDGWDVIGLKRGQAETVVRDGITWMGGDAMDRDAVVAAADGCAVIIHAVNPPGYRDWDKLVMPMLHNTIAAAERHGALVVLPGTVYNFGPDAFPVLAEDAPQHPVTRKGAVRVEMEQALQAYAARGGRVLIVRAGDFFGPRVGNNWFAQGMVRPGRPLTSVANPCDPGVGHQWAYLPDVAATISALLARRAELPPFARFHMGGHWDPDGTRMVDAVVRAGARAGATPTVKRVPWWLLRLASPFVPTLRELQEMRYLWRQPVRMDNARLVAFLGAEPHTPLDEAVATTLQGLGCLQDPAQRRCTDAHEATPASSSTMAATSMGVGQRPSHR